MTRLLAAIIWAKSCCVAPLVQRKRKTVTDEILPFSTLARAQFMCIQKLKEEVFYHWLWCHSHCTLGPSQHDFFMILLSASVCVSDILQFNDQNVAFGTEAEIIPSSFTCISPLYMHTFPHMSPTFLPSSLQSFLLGLFIFIAVLPWRETSWRRYKRKYYKLAMAASCQLFPLSHPV